jgi:hypothetical protein
LRDHPASDRVENGLLKHGRWLPILIDEISGRTLNPTFAQSRSVFCLEIKSLIVSFVEARLPLHVATSDDGRSANRLCSLHTGDSVAQNLIRKSLMSFIPSGVYSFSDGRVIKSVKYFEAGAGSFWDATHTIPTGKPCIPQERIQASVGGPN